MIPAKSFLYRAIDCIRDMVTAWFWKEETTWAATYCSPGIHTHSLSLLRSCAVYASVANIWGCLNPKPLTLLTSGKCCSTEYSVSYPNFLHTKSFCCSSQSSSFLFFCLLFLMFLLWVLSPFPFFSSFVFLFGLSVCVVPPFFLGVFGSSWVFVELASHHGWVFPVTARFSDREKNSLWACTFLLPDSWWDSVNTASFGFHAWLNEWVMVGSTCRSFTSNHIDFVLWGFWGDSWTWEHGLSTWYIPASLKLEN